jgi:hypothetical protein
MHSWDEPFERIYKLAQGKSVNLATPVMGERLSIGEPHGGGAWWLSAQN